MTNENRFVLAIRDALNVLGEGCPDCKCAGCSAEMAEAIRVLREALTGFPAKEAADV